jgi:hypothetical protein
MKEETALGKVSFFHQKALLLIFGNFFDYFSHQKSSLTYFFKIFFFAFLIYVRNGDHILNERGNRSWNCMYAIFIKKALLLNYSLVLKKHPYKLEQCKQGDQGPML